MKRLDFRRMAGVTLVELMISLAIGAFLLLGLTQVFGASRAAYQLSEGMARTQENARFAMDYLQRDIRMAGHYGCVNDQSHLQTPGSLQPHFGGAPAFPLDFNVSIQGYEAPGTAPGNSLTLGAAWGAVTGLPAEISTLSPAPRPGSDIIVLRYFSNEGAPVTNITKAGSVESVTVATGRWAALTTDGVATPTLFGIADCSHADVFAGAGTGTVAVSGAAAPATDLLAAIPRSLRVKPCCTGPNRSFITSAMALPANRRFFARVTTAPLTERPKNWWRASKTCSSCTAGTAKRI